MDLFVRLFGTVRLHPAGVLPLHIYRHVFVAAILVTLEGFLHDWKVRTS